MHAIEMKGLTKYYGKTLGAKNLNLTIPTGSFYGFIGPNGAGKSTTLRMLLNIIFPTEGKGLILGKDIVKDAFDIKHFVGYLPSSINLYKGLKVHQLIKQTIEYYQNSTWCDDSLTKDWSNCIYKLKSTKREQQISNNVNYLVDTLQLDVNKKVGALSFGNSKKLGIVLSMLHSPKVLILDEPTGGLDPLMQDKYFDLLKEQHDLGCTIFFSSHILSEVEKVCDKVAIIKNGQIIRDEGVEHLKQNNLKQVSVWVNQTEINDLLLSFNLTVDTPDLIIRQQKNNIKRLSFNYSGKVNDLVQKLAKFKVTNLTVSEPTLEDIFKHYYE